MLKLYKYLVLIIFIISLCHVYSQDETMSIQWDKPINDGLIIRPLNVSNHAYLFESDQVNFKAYYWVEYLGNVDSVNNIHKIRQYEKDGHKYENYYYFVLEQDKDFSVDTNEYKVSDVLSKVMTVESSEKKADFFPFFASLKRIL